MSTSLKFIAFTASAFLFSFQLVALPYATCPGALIAIENSAPAVVPKAPPAPTRTPVRPKPAEPRPTEPKRREVPIPRPDEPGRQIPAKPLIDPKDIQPEDLYSTDPRVVSFWRDLPLGLKRIMVEEMRKEKAKLEAHMRERYGDSSAKALLRTTLSLQEDIESIESNHKKEILEVIGRMMEMRYGSSIQNLSIRITNELPLASAPSSDGRRIPELPRSLDEGMVYRTEMRNLWLQGEGWVGMKEFAYLYGPELNAIHPGLAEKYQELDRLYRLGQLAQLDLVPLPEMVDQIPKEMISQGREIVTSDYEIVESVDGSPSIRVSETKGVAVGRNAWAAAHEARKAASQMVTPAEGAYRWMLPEDRRLQLDEATNSARAEIRQGVFGPAVVQALKKRFDLIAGESLSDQDYYPIMDGYFSLPPGIFVHVNKLLFESNFESSRALQAQTREILKESGVME